MRLRLFQQLFRIFLTLLEAVGFLVNLLYNFSFLTQDLTKALVIHGFLGIRLPLM